MSNIPQFVKEMLNKQYEDEYVDKIIEGYSKKRFVSLRANTIKASVEEIEKVLEKEKIEYEKTSFSNNAFIIKNSSKKEIEELDIYKDGKIYMQSLSSMLPPIILDPKEGEDILDMAAAPGGKTTQIAAITNNNSHITACELNEIRLERLKYNIDKQGANSVFVMKQDARRIDDYFSFDRILLDAPCSGSGTINIEDKNIEKTITPKLVEKCIKSQFELLNKAIKILKPGHEMVYSTCSILECENEDILNRILKNNPKIKIVPVTIKGIEDMNLLPSKIDGTICVMPNEFFEGFFIAKIYKEK